MKVYFIKDVPAVAKAGEIKEVSGGYWRNFLLPKKLALMATEKIIQEAEKKKAAEAKHREQEAQHFSVLQHQLDSATVTIKAKASAEGKLFGGIGAKTIAEHLTKKGMSVDESMVEVSHSLKDLGEHKVTIKLPHGLHSTVKVVIEAEK